MSSLRIVHQTLIQSLLVGVCITSSFNVACATDPELLFEDNYSVVDGSFNSTDNVKFSVNDNIMSIASDASWWIRAIYQSTLVDDADISVQLRLSEPDAEKGAYVGVVFWALDYSDYCFVALSDSGTVGAITTNSKRTLSPVPWRQSKALKTGKDVWNTLRVVTAGSRATIYLNGTKVASFKGKPPQGGSLIGVIHSAGSDPSVGQFREFKVMSLSSADAVPATVEDPDVILADDFSELDPGWGIESGQMFVKEKTLIFKPEPGYALRQFYQTTTVAEIDAKVNVRVSDNDKESSCGAGLIFWGLAADDYFSFQLDDQGQIGVSHRKRDRWLTPLTYKAPPKEVQLKSDGANELRVVTYGKMATCYVNGVSVGVVNGVPFKGEWQFGLYAENGKAQATAEFSNLVVRKPSAAK